MIFTVTPWWTCAIAGGDTKADCFADFKRLDMLKTCDKVDIYSSHPEKVDHADT